MNDALGFCELCLCWFAAIYAVCDDPVCDRSTGWPRRNDLVSRWSAYVLLRSTAGAIAWWALSGGGGSWAMASVWLFCASMVTPWLRRQFVTVQRLVEFELLANGVFLLATWTWKSLWMGLGVAFSNFGLSRSQTGALCMAAALMIYMVRGGNYLVRGILKKAGGMPDGTSSNEAREGLNHGRMIGQIERLVVVLIVMLGNLQALAFFFAAKGLIRSKELEDRRQADYFLLGSLSSFLIALSAGLVLQKVFSLLWK